MMPRSSSPRHDFWKNKRVLVTGHTGFKGAWLTLWLQRMGADVLGYALAPATKPSLCALVGLEQHIRYVIGDIRDQAHFRNVYEAFQPEIVLHLAAQALVLPSYQDPVGTYATNIMGTIHVLETARQIKSAKAVLIVTSDKCYENREWAWGYRENEAMGGCDPYSSSKGCAEIITAAYRQSFFAGVGVASGRAGNVIGGGDWAADRLIPDCVRALEKGEAINIRNPASIRPWQHVLEPLSGYLLLTEKLFDSPLEFSKGWNFGPEPFDTQPVAWIADRMVSIWGSGASWKDVSDPGAPHEAHYLKLDCSLAQAGLNWRPRLSIGQTLEWVVEWYRRVSAGESARELTLKQIVQYEDL